jgi:hypothetical protein
VSEFTSERAGQELNHANPSYCEDLQSGSIPGRRIPATNGREERMLYEGIESRESERSEDSHRVQFPAGA